MASAKLTLVSSQSPEKELSQGVRATRSRKWKSNNPEKARAIQRACDARAKLRCPKDVWVKYVLREAKKRAEKKGVSFALIAEDITIPDFCPYLGMKLEIRFAGKVFPNSPSLDRLHPELGYVPGNVQVISHRANTIKSFGTAEEHERIAFVMKQQGLK